MYISPPQVLGELTVVFSAGPRSRFRDLKCCLKDSESSFSENNGKNRQFLSSYHIQMFAVCSERG